jgi:hypothetical protein
MNRLNSGRDTPRVQWLDQGREHPHRIALSCQVAAVEEVMSRLADQITKRGVLVSGAGGGGGGGVGPGVCGVEAGGCMWPVQVVGDGRRCAANEAPGMLKAWNCLGVAAAHIT